MPNEMLQDKTISHKARGVLCYLLSHSDDWEVRREDLETEKDGDAAIRSALNELKQAGYIVWERQRDDQGKLLGYNYSVYDTRQPRPIIQLGKKPHVDNPRVEKPRMEKPLVGNHTPTNNQEEQIIKKNKRPPISPKAKSREQKGKTAIPEPFVISDSSRQWFELKFPDLDIEQTTEQWEDWCKANDRRYKDWQAAWKNGMVNAVKFGLAVRRSVRPGEDIF